MATASPMASSIFVADVQLPRFTEAVDVEKYKCVQCQGMLRPPVRQTMCGHRLCAICLEEVLQSENTMCPGQEDDEEECVDLKSPDSVNVTQILSFSFMLSGNKLNHPQ